MLPLDRRLDPDVQEDLERLDAALREDADADPALLTLVGDVRAVRPTLDAEARARLDDRAREAKARAGAPVAGRRSFLPAGRGWRLGLAVAALLAVAVPVAGVVLVDEDSGFMSIQSTSDVVDAQSSSDSSVQSESTEPPSAATSRFAPRATNLSRTLGSSAPGGRPRRVVRDVRQTVRVDPDGVARAAADVTRIVQDAGGYVAASSIRERGSGAGGTFEIVVPSARLNETVAALSRTGRPVRLERSSTDVTNRATSLQDRLADLRADRAALRLQLARTVDEDRRAARRRELRLLSSRVTQLERQRDALRDSTANSRVSLRLTTSKGASASAPKADDGRWGLDDAWRDAGRVLQTVAGVLLIAAVVLLPIGLIVALTMLVRRRLRADRANQTIGRS